MKEWCLTVDDVCTKRLLLDLLLIRINLIIFSWTLQGSSAVSGRTVNDFMRAALIDKDYHWYGTNCITAAIRMWFLVDKPFNLK